MRWILLVGIVIFVFLFLRNRGKHRNTVSNKKSKVMVEKFKKGKIPTVVINNGEEVLSPVEALCPGRKVVNYD